MIDLQVHSPWSLYTSMKTTSGEALQRKHGYPTYPSLSVFTVTGSLSVGGQASNRYSMSTSQSAIICNWILPPQYSIQWQYRLSAYTLISTRYRSNCICCKTQIAWHHTSATHTQTYTPICTHHTVHIILYIHIQHTHTHFYRISHFYIISIKAIQ